MKRININLPKEDLEHLREEAFKRRVSMSELFRRFIADGLKTPEDWMKEREGKWDSKPSQSAEKFSEVRPAPKPSKGR